MKIQQFNQCLLLVLSLIVAPTFAYEKGDWAIALGVHTVDPKSDNGTLANGAFETKVGSNTRPTITVEYFLSPSWGIEVLASLPFKHKVELNGTTAAEVTHLPPTVSFQYHFGGESVRSFVGIGLNYTLFDADTEGPIAGTKLELSDSTGLAVHAGIDFSVGDDSAIRIDVRKIDIDADVEVDGADVGEVNIDPFVYGIAYVWKF